MLLFVAGALGPKEKEPAPDSWYARLAGLFLADEWVEDPIWGARLEHGDALPPAPPRTGGDLVSLPLLPPWLDRAPTAEPRPPRPLADLIPTGASVGLYHAAPGEAPTGGYARWLFEAGHPLALPWFADRSAPMQFRSWDNPHVDELLEPAPWGSLQPRSDAQNIALMNLAGVCRNCLGKWYKAAADERGIELSADQARDTIYGMPYAEWKAQYQQEASAEQQAAFEKGKTS